MSSSSSSAIPIQRRRSSVSTAARATTESPRSSLHTRARNAQRRFSQSSSFKDHSNATSSSLKRHGSVLEDEVFDDSPATGPESESKPKKSTASKRAPRKEIYQCEVCHKSYSHSACLIKHRWQHTDYWQQASALMMSKHQSVMLLEAAAILTNGSSLPNERSYWPAAISPPTSGLLGSDIVNRDIISSERYSSFGQAALGTSVVSESSVPPEDRDDSPTDSYGQDDGEEQQQDEEEMFLMEDMEDMKISTDRLSSPVSERSSANHFSSMFTVSSNSKHGPSGFNYGTSAPTLGFFSPRPATQSAFVLPHPRPTTSEDDSTDMEL